MLDALVVGAGPVGLLMAAELAQRGCKVRVIDASEEAPKLTKASGIAARSLEVLPQQVVDKVLATAVHVRRVRMFEFSGGSSKCLVDVGLQSIENYSGIMAQEQWRTEDMLREHLASIHCGFKPGTADPIRVKPERPVRLKAFTAYSDHVSCTLYGKNNPMGLEDETVQCRFLLGCDGGASFVRKQLGLAFPGETTQESFLALHATLENAPFRPHHSDGYFSAGDDPMAAGFTFSMPLPDGGHLLIVDLDETQQAQWKTGKKDRHGLDELRQPTPEDVLAVLRARGLGEARLKPGSVRWCTQFRVNSRQAEHYGGGRVWLAGDACHCHSPLGGQGMNMGFQDAKNLAWKIAMVAKGTCRPALLATYEQERRGIETKILHAIERGQHATSARGPLIFFLRGRGQRLAGFFASAFGDTVPGSIAAYMSQQAWSYSDSPLSFEHWERPGALTTLQQAVLSLGTRVYRREQNLFRWLAPRVRAGDRVPNVPLEGDELHTALKRSKGWTLLLFEGQAEDNARQRAALGAGALSAAELRQLGEALQAKADESGYVAGIDSVLVFEQASEDAHARFGARGQCLFLVRPDHHVGLRCEPVRKGVVTRYLADHAQVDDVRYFAAPGSAPAFDPLPAGAAGVLLSLLAYAFRHRLEFWD